MTERVLMIEDDARLSEMVGEYLGPLGIEVTAQPDANSGLDLLRRSRFDAIILDVMLPDLDGFESPS
jgi:DNA-binding response OmpR family regulator